MMGGLKFGNKPLTIRWYLLTPRYTTIRVKLSRQPRQAGNPSSTQNPGKVKM